MEKRGKLWRKRKGWLRFKARMVRFAGYGRFIRDTDGRLVTNPSWLELAKHKSCLVYKTTGTPCSCHLCKSERYNRREFKKASRLQIKESFD